MRSEFRAFLTAAALLTPACPVRAADTVAVLASEKGAYLEAFSAFQAEYGSGVRHFDSSRGKAAVPPGTATVVTFGIKAMAQAYPLEANMVACLAPGYFFPQEGRHGRAIKISMLPSFPRLFSTLKKVQPQLKKLRVFWMVESYKEFREPIVAAGAEAGVQVTPVRVSSVADLPSLLRGAHGDMDAFFLPPDPLLISPESLMIFREFSWSNGIPMYASTRGIAKEGATASIGISFAESGAAAARTARALQAGEPQPPVVFPDRIELTLNATAARKCGLHFSADLLREADYLFP